MRILHLTNTFKVDGTGITNVAADLALAQAAAGHAVTVACAEADERMSALAHDHGVEIVTGIAATSVRVAAASVRALRRDPRRTAADILHVHTVRATMLAALAFPAAFRARSVATVHNGFRPAALAMCAAGAVVCVSAADARAVRRAAMVRHPLVIGNGTLGSLRTAPIAEVTPADLSHPAIVYVGALAARKGVDVLLHAMVHVVARHPRARLLLVGNRDEPQMERLANLLGLGDHVEFVGFREDPRDHMLAADVFVLPSRAEPFGLVLVEARESGAPIIAADVGGVREALSGGRAGDLVPPGDADALAHAISAVLDDPSHARDLRARGRAGLDRYSVQRMSDAYLRLYERLLARNGRVRTTDNGDVHTNVM